MRTLSWALTLSVVTVVSVAGAASASLFPKAGNENQRQWEALFTEVFWIALVVFVIVQALIVYAIVRFRRRPDGPQEGPHIHGNTKMEIAWTIAPTLVMAWLLVISIRGMGITDDEPIPDFEVEVWGSQWLWEFHYPAYGGFPESQSVNNLYVEAGRVVKLNLRSKDVIHAFAIPQLGVMKDAEPGVTNSIYFEADEPGNYSALCRELCGIAGHGKMRATVVVFAPGSQTVPFGPKPQAATSATNTTGPAADVTIPVALADFTITPKEQTVEPGQKVLFRVTNNGPSTHNLYISSSRSDPEVQWKTPEAMRPGDTFDLVVDIPTTPGAWQWWCNVAGHDISGMIGVLSSGGTLGGEKVPLLPGPGLATVIVAIGALAFLLRRRT